jgi:predicted molibdopterin-dependent oxidoreductase YjgC
VRKNGTLERVSWDEALHVVTERLKPLAGKNGNGVAALASTRLPVESLYAFRALFKDCLGSSNVTSIEENSTFAAQRQAKNGVVSLNGSLDVLKNADCVIAVGVDLVSNHQVAGFFVKRNLPFGTRLVVIDPVNSKMSEIADYALHIHPGADRDLLLGIAAEISRQGLAKGELDPSVDLSQISLASSSQATGIDTNTLQAVSNLIAAAQQPAFVYGKGITRDGAPQALNALVLLARLTGVKDLVHPKGEANSMAALRIGLDGSFEPHRRKTVFLALGDDVPGEHLARKLEGVPFLAIQASYLTPVVEKADVVFPVTTWMEQDGHYLNMEGRLQEAHRAVEAAEGVWSNTSVLEAITSRLGFQVKNGWLEAVRQG